MYNIPIIGVQIFIGVIVEHCCLMLFSDKNVYISITYVTTTVFLKTH